MRRRLKLIAHKLSEGLLVVAGVRLLALIARRYAFSMAGAYAIPVMALALGASTLVYFVTEGVVA